MDNHVFCNKHSISSEDEEWKVTLEELTGEGDDDDRTEPFTGQVCPLCFIALRDRMRKARRQLKIEGRQNIRLRQENEELRAIVDAVVATVKGITGKDPEKLAEKEFEKHSAQPGPKMVEQGDLKNILPNLITEAAHKVRENGERDA